MPILGIIASQQPGHISTNSYESISTVTLGSSSSSITFSSIPSTYTHLQIRVLAKGDRGIWLENAYVQFNSDSSSANYYDHALYGDGSSAAAGTSANTGVLIYTFGGNGGASGSTLFGSGVIDILDYKNTNKYKTLRYLGGTENNTNGLIGVGSGLWKNTSAISSITMIPTVGSNWLANSKFALYGIKGA